MSTPWPPPKTATQLDQQNRAVLEARKRAKRKVKLTARQLRAAISALTAMQAGEGRGLGDWPDWPAEVSHADLEGALEKLQLLFTRSSAKELLKLTHGEMFKEEQ